MVVYGLSERENLGWMRRHDQDLASEEAAVIIGPEQTVMPLGTDISGWGTGRAFLSRN